MLGGRAANQEKSELLSVGSLLDHFGELVGGLSEGLNRLKKGLKEGKEYVVRGARIGGRGPIIGTQNLKVQKGGWGGGGAGWGGGGGRKKATGTNFREKSGIILLLWRFSETLWCPSREEDKGYFWRGCKN